MKKKLFLRQLNIVNIVENIRNIQMNNNKLVCYSCYRDIVIQSLFYIK